MNAAVRRKPIKRALAFLALISLSQPLLAQDDEPLRTSNGLALTPPMGWNSWNKFGCNVDEDLIRRIADGLVSSGMRDAGYQYVVIDDCWHGERDADGNIQPDPKRFPSGIKALVDYVHARGLKFGIYSDAGKMTCAKRPGSQGHEYQDARQYAKWGVDYLKYDWCHTGRRNPQEAYTTMSDALRASGRDIVLSICEWGNAKPWLWGKNVGNLWRTTGDIMDKWDGHKDWPHGLMPILDWQAELSEYAGPGHWNDPDMMEVGNGGMTDGEYRTHFSLWGMLAAPMIAGNDVSNMDAATKAILLNKDVIAVDQDVLGKQGKRVVKDGDKEIWVRELSDGRRAVVLFNRGAKTLPMSFDWSQAGLAAGQKVKLRDLWSKNEMTTAKGSFAATVGSHASVMVTLEPVR